MVSESKPPGEKIPTDVNLQQLGIRLRAARRRTGMSVAAAAAAAGLSTGFISLLENGKTDATVGRLTRLLIVYGLSIADAFGLAAPESSESGSVLPMASEYLSPKERLKYRFYDSDHSDVIPVHVFIEPGGGWLDVSAHKGEETIFVLHGTVELQAGDETVQLVPGDRYTIPMFVPHSYRALSDERSELFVLLRDPEVLARTAQMHGTRSEILE